MTRKALAVFAVVACVFPATRASAGPFSDELGKCLVRSTTREDREALVRWEFAALASHPAVKPVVSVSKKQMDAANKTMAELLMRLLSTACKSETKAALQFEGDAALNTGFQVLGNVAATELLSSPEVIANLSGLAEHLDPKRLEALVQETATGTK